MTTPMSANDPKSWLEAERENEGYTNYASAGVAMWLSNNEPAHNN